MEHPHCSFFISSRQSCCKFAARHEYNSEKYCKTHFNYMKSHDECAICLLPMDNTKKRFKLSCGHYFHKSCLAGCQKAECPLCRAVFVPAEACEIFHDTIIMPLAMNMFSAPTALQVYAVSSVRMINSLVQKGEWFASSVHHMLQLFDNNTHNINALCDGMYAFSNTVVGRDLQDTLED